MLRSSGRSIEEACGLPVYGTVPRMTDLPFTQRHLGLIPPEEHGRIKKALDRAGAIARDYLDIEGLLQVARSASPWGIDAFPHQAALHKPGSEPVRIGVIRDAAFQFYYQENLEALTDRGARIVPLSALDDKCLPSLDALYIGGGFPETQAARLAENEAFRLALRAEAQAGLPIYAECGGFIYLGESLSIGDARYPMAGVLPVAFGMETRPQGHGYTEFEVDAENPFFAVGTRLKGHEFHYCRMLSLKEDGLRTVYRMKKGTGIGGGRDGVVWRDNILAGFTHLHALGTPQWAEALIGAGRRHQERQNREGRLCDKKSVERMIW